MDAATYQSAFLTLLADLQDAGVISADTIVLANGLYANSVSRAAFNRNSLQPIAAQDRRFAYVTSHLLTTDDGTHFTGASLYAHARRLFAAWEFVSGKQ
jgi:glycine/D-amino acid oxidase-like deaminating enzyme